VHIYIYIYLTHLAIIVAIIILYESSGSYRDAWRFYRPGVSEFVLKRYQLQYKYNHNFKDLKKVQNEAIIMERLSPSPRVLDIYGHCGTSVLLEAMAGDIHTRIIPTKGLIEQKQLDRMQKEDAHPMNKFTAQEKFKIALEMAESLADIHGFEGGQVIHCDTHIEQWLLAHDGSVKLNDFNNAVVSQWNEDEGMYCTSTAWYSGRVS
jgi:serine/threonine protein kinase